MGYEHTQKGPWHFLLFAVSAACFAAGWTMRLEPVGHYVCLGVSLLMLIVAFGFMNLTIRDETNALGIRFGPLPLFSTTVPYDKIRQVELDRTHILDGWGIHWVPRRGTTYNIWGFDCVRVELENRTLRIGTDDSENLIALLRDRIAQNPRNADQ